LRNKARTRTPFLFKYFSCSAALSQHSSTCCLLASWLRDTFESILVACVTLAARSEKDDSSGGSGRGGAGASGGAAIDHVLQRRQRVMNKFTSES
jgi:hypothetical protein